jgi:hypothetical protein
MSGRNRLTRETLVSAVTLGLALASGESTAQVVNSSSSYGGAPDPNPYYIGVSAALTHNSNVFSVQDGPGDTYASGSLLGGFDQQIGRQRVFGRASVSDNRYQNEDVLNNVSYNVYGGLAWETIENLSGNLNVALDRNLAVPAAIAGAPTQTRNQATTESIDAAARWGGPSLFTLEALANYGETSYSEPTYVTSESNRVGGSLGIYYHSGGPLRVGLAARVDRTRTPKAFIDPNTGQYTATRLDGRNIDLLLDYDVSGQLVGNARLSYTRQTNAYVSSTAFSGVTGGVALNWTVTGKTSIRFDAAHDAGFNSQAYNTFIFTPTSSGGATLTPVLGVYSNNQITDSAGLGANYIATAKITASANLRYLRARSTPQDFSGPLPDIVDISKIAAIGANYAITRSWGAGCNASYAKRDVSGGQTFAYDVKSVGCSTQFTWR